MGGRLSVLFCLYFLCGAAFANDCLDYKLRPSIYVAAPDWSKQVVQPLQNMDLLHGDVIATLVDNYEITGDVTSIEDGFCVALKSVDATVGYSDFLVQIDMRHAPNTCSYNAILSHEDEHIRAYLSVIDDLMGDIHRAVYSAADSIMPIFVQQESEIESALDKLNDNLQAHPDLILIKQNIKSQEEIRNKRVDMHDDGAALRRCFVSGI